VRLIRFHSADAAEQVDHDTLAEEDGVLAAWFDRHGCRAAIVRPDHYIFGVASDEGTLGKMLTDLATGLQ
jgi:3-(3-hydroxy-phenyl)propionate hydroxylase